MDSRTTFQLLISSRPSPATTFSVNWIAGEFFHILIAEEAVNESIVANVFPGTVTDPSDRTKVPVDVSFFKDVGFAVDLGHNGYVG